MNEEFRIEKIDYGEKVRAVAIYIERWKIVEVCKIPGESACLSLNHSVTIPLKQALTVLKVLQKATEIAKEWNDEDKSFRDNESS